MSFAFNAPWNERLAISRRVLNALILREINGRFGASRMGYLWALVNPMVALGVLYFLFSTIRNRDFGLPLAMFLVTGWFVYGFYQSMTAQVAQGEAASRALLMHQNVTRLDVMGSRAALDFMTTISVTLIASIIAMSIEGFAMPANLTLFTMSFLGAGLFGLGLGVTMGAIMTYFPFAMNFVQPINRIGFFVSAVIFTVADLPSWTHQYIKWNPMVHAVEGARQGWFEAYRSPILDLGYLYSVAFPLIAIGLYLERRTRRGIKF